MDGSRFWLCVQIIVFSGHRPSPYNKRGAADVRGQSVSLGGYQASATPTTSSQAPVAVKNERGQEQRELEDHQVGASALEGINAAAPASTHSFPSVTKSFDNGSRKTADPTSTVDL